MGRLQKIGVYLVGTVVVLAGIVYVTDTVAKWNERRSFYNEVSAYYDWSGKKAAWQSYRMTERQLSPEARMEVRYRLNQLDNRLPVRTEFGGIDSYNRVMLDIYSDIRNQLHEERRANGWNDDMFWAALRDSPAQTVIDMHQAHSDIDLMLLRIALDDLGLSKREYSREDLRRDKEQFPALRDRLDRFLAAQ